MAILDRYILKQVAGIFLFGVGIFAVFLMANELFFLARVALRVHMPFSTVVRLLVLRIPFTLGFSLPMALLLGTLLAFGRLSDRNEVVAMRTSGISLGRVAVPVLLAGFLVALADAALNEWLVPLAGERYRAEFAAASGSPPVGDGHLLFRESDGESVSVFYAKGVGKQAEILEGMTVNQFEDGRLVRVIEAARARYRPTSGWTFENGVLYLLSDATTVQTRFDRMRVGLRRTPAEILLERRDPSEMTIRELQAYMGVLRRAGESIVRYAVWLHSRVAIPGSSIVFALLAVPLGLRPHRSGPAIGMAMTILILLFYYLLMNTTLALGQTGRLPAFLAAWTPNLVFGCLGGYLLWRAT